MVKVKNKIELISMHIPKTAGTSLRNMLKEHYGEKHAVRFDINITTKRIDIENQEFDKNKLPGKIKVIHGHFYYQDLVDQLNLATDVKMITWLRDPVDRVISNYFYLSKRLKEELDEEARGLNILAKMQKSLTEYARNEISRNRMYKFLEGAELKKFLFVGIYEKYNEDMLDLADILGIASPEIFMHNITGSKEKVSQEVIDEIKELNALDMDLYQQACKIRNLRKSKQE